MSDTASETLRHTDGRPWTMPGGFVPRVRAWDGHYCVYHPLSGDTHLLGEDAMRILARVAEGGCGDADLAACLDGLEPGEAAPLAAGIAGDLEAIGLIERRP